MTDFKYILSIYIGVHDSCITISSEEEVLLHLEAERVFRKKHMRCTPEEIQHLVAIGLDYLQLSIDDIDELIMSEDDRRTKKIDTFFSGSNDNQARILGKSFEPFYVPHHASHIATCFPSGYEDALIICADGGSREGSTRFYYKTDDEIRDIANFGDDIITGKFYGTITQLIIDPDIYKAHVNSPGKTMGLAGWGEFSEEFYVLLGQNRDELNQLYFKPVTDLRKRFKLSDDYSRPWLDKRRRDLAFTAQKFWIDHFIQRIDQYAHLSRNICLVGGCALNVNLNTSIVETGMFDNIYIPPIASDCGQSLGAILHLYPKIKVSYPFLGRGFGEVDVLPSQIIDDLLSRKIIAWYQGRSEIGPRALGHRSFIGLPGSMEMKVQLSEKVKGREPYRPVSPTVLMHEVEKYFDFNSHSDYMTFSPLAKDITKEKAPAVVHRDNSSRIQTLSRSDNPVLAMILEGLLSRGEPPIIMNTSFNVMGQPIVDTPDDALSTFKDCSADVLYINGNRYTK